MSKTSLNSSTRKMLTFINLHLFFFVAKRELRHLNKEGPLTQLKFSVITRVIYFCLLSQK